MTNEKWRSRRLGRLGSAIFAEVSEWKAEARRQGKDVIALDIGSPDRPPLERIREALAEASLKPDMYRYPGTEGSDRFRRKAAEWFEHRFGVELDPAREILSLMGTQDGLAHLALAVTDPGDCAMLPDPGYPVYQAGLAVAGVETIPLPLLADNDYLPDFDAIPDAVWDKAKFMLLSYPSNPVTAVADLAFFERAVDVARRRGVLLVHDNAYSEMAFDGFRPPSVLQVPGAAEVAIEFHSLSKSFHLAGGRIGFAVGNPQVLDALRALKNNIDFGVFLAVQEAAVAALDLDMRDPHPVSAIYEGRRDAFIGALGAEGWVVSPPRGTMFAWAPVPPGWSSRQISRAMLSNTGVAVIPGNAFGALGEGYVRFAMVEEEDRLREAARRIGQFLRHHEPVSER
ncbi:aminotransferase class I/II-fold pyridoxal phosphate-dependent enzyme [Cohnella nanjingensis]|uniref:Aminotransferase class I/II-fold pyridoxal phosphate-dependent enzyme n=1 Tax=Cohnella nanjingensis TaxID=1387779 RepID=A0A7X0VEM0_9BACL|nr:aminotransferase class I/II-fold pyridoxal phosphate-dependent enzyme [Cohnella nanjingensis]MBB6669699.1 aminotransferase class I/II-fold pyridoxal phosphate-dependent enzyme [Cohnella nanjingensis]